MTLPGCNDLRNRAFQAAHAMVAEGVIGRPLTFRGSYDEDCSADPLLPWSWRMTPAGGGPGAPGDPGCHLLSVMVALMGQVANLTAMTRIAVPMRHSFEGFRMIGNEDGALAVTRFTSGAQGSFATSRVARGRKCRLPWKIHGLMGTLVFDQEHINELSVHRAI